MAKTSYYVELEEKIKPIDIPSMSELDDVSYRDVVITKLFFVDHHEILRDAVTGHPIATSIEQLDILVEELNNMRSRMIYRNS